MKTTIGPLWEFLKGPQLGVPLKCPVHPHSACGASAGVLNPGGARLALMWCAPGLVRAGVVGVGGVGGVGRWVDVRGREDGEKKGG